MSLFYEHSQNYPFHFLVATLLSLLPAFLIIFSYNSYFILYIISLAPVLVVENLTAMLWVSVSFKNAYVEILTPKMVVLDVGPLGVA